MTEGLPSASTKLRLVLDYLPCEACLSQPTADQELLCSICSRLHREVDATRVARTVVLLERPSAVALPAPAPLPAPAEVTVPAPVVEAWPVVGVDVLVEPYAEEPAPVVAPVPAPPLEEAPAVAEAPAPPPEEPKRRGFSLFRRRKDEEPGRPPEEPVFDDVAEYTGGPLPERRKAEQEPSFGDEFEFTREERPAAAEPEERDEGFAFSEREPVPPEPPTRPLDELEDDFLYKPPGERIVEEPPEDLLPREEVSLEPEQGPSPWAPPEERLFEEEARRPEPVPEWPEEPIEREIPVRVEEAPEEILEMEIVEDEPPAAPPEEEIVETEIVEMEVVEDEPPAPAPPEPERVPEPAPEPREERRSRFGLPSLFKRRREEPAREPEPAPAPEPETREAWAAPPAEPEPADEAVPLPPAEPEAPADDASDLYRLRGFDRGHRALLQQHGIEAISHLSGHDPNELADRAGVDRALLASWVQVADLVQEVGVPVHAALALVAAGVEGPRGLRDLDAEAIMDRVGAFGEEGSVSLSDVKRWKRRA